MTPWRSITSNASSGAKRPLQRDDLAAEVERRQQRVHQAAGPRPVGRATRTRRRPAGTSSGCRRSPAGCRSARDAGSARPSAGRSCRWCRSAPRHRRRCVFAASKRPRSAASARVQSTSPCPSARADARPRSPAPGRAAARSRTLAMRALVDDREARLAVVDAVLERVGAEQHRQRHRDRAELVERDVRDRGLEALRHDERDAVAAARRRARAARSTSRSASRSQLARR